MGDQCIQPMTERRGQCVQCLFEFYSHLTTAARNMRADPYIHFYIIYGFTGLRDLNAGLLERPKQKVAH